MEGHRFSDGLHQAIEAKEGVRIQEESEQVHQLLAKHVPHVQKLSMTWYSQN